jgi:Protein of unknown function (DUF3990)
MSFLLVSANIPWPVWKNPEIQLYHGTIQTNAESILDHGVDVSKGAATTDFGRGFYTTTDEENAREWSERKARRIGGDPAVLRLTLSRLALGRLESIVFIRGSLLAKEYWSFVAHCRSGFPHRPATGDFYDVAFGPVAKVWFGNPNSAVWADYDQISFHTLAARDMLNNRSLCTLEIVS